jgi:hypothetical protein
LLELVVTMGLLTLGIVAAQATVERSVRAATTSTNTFLAGHLAEEGIELVRSIRMGNWLAGVAWDQSLADGDYLVQYTLTTPSVGVPALWLGAPGCCASSARPLDFDATGRRYGYSGWPGFTGQPSGFRRVVTVQHVASGFADPYLRVTSAVSWGPSFEHVVSLDEHLYAWF